MKSRPRSATATRNNNPFVEWYGNRIGEPTTTDEAFGFVGVLLVMLSSTAREPIRGAGTGLAAAGLVFLLIGPIIRLPLKRSATVVSVLGAVVCLGAVAWVFAVFPDAWSASFEHSEAQITASTGLGRSSSPSVASPCRCSLARARSSWPQRPAQRPQSHSVTPRSRRQSTRPEGCHSGGEPRAAGRGAHPDQRRPVTVRAVRRRGRGWRWRLRHRNGNVITDSAGGYAERNSAEAGIHGVKRDAPNADVEQSKH